MDIWSGSRLNAVERSLCGDELLGMDKNIVEDETSHLFGHVPIPPPLDNQMDTAIIQFMSERAKILLYLTWRELKSRKKEAWLELWLTCYIILNTIEFVVKTQKDYMDYLGSTVRLAILVWYLDEILVLRTDYSIANISSPTLAVFPEGLPTARTCLT